MKIKIIASEEPLAKPQDLSRERLELIVSQMVDIMNEPALGETKQKSKILRVLQYFNLIK